MSLAYKLLAVYVDSRKNKHFNKLLTFRIYSEVGFYRMLHLIFKTNDVVRSLWYESKKVDIQEVLFEAFEASENKELFYLNVSAHLLKYPELNDHLQLLINPSKLMSLMARQAKETIKTLNTKNSVK